MGGSLDRDKLADMLLFAALTQLYSHFEARLAGAIDPQDTRIRERIADAAIDHFLKTCGDQLAPQVESRRAELLPLLVAQRLLLNESLFELTKDLPRPLFIGPVNTIFNVLRRVNLVLVGDTMTPSGLYAQSVKDMLLAESLYLDGRAISWSDLANRNCVLYGTPELSLIAELLSASGWEVTPSHVRLGELVVAGDRLALIACRARPTDPTLGDVVYTSADETTLIGVNGLHHGPWDYVIGRAPEPGRWETVTRGNFEKTDDARLLTIPVRQVATSTT